MRTHPQLQSEAAECGLACLAMLSSAHGETLQLSRTQRATPSIFLMTRAIA
ncbi:MAG: hypothetical protein LC098_12270 [Burkholderiales bacterium]|nr:hypothetical protein [Burkholderiales bacterium]